MKTVCDRIKYLVKASGESQRFISEKTGISQNYISCFVTDKREPNPKDMYKLAKYFNVNYDWLRTGEGEMPALPHLHKIVDMPPSPLVLQSIAKDNTELLNSIRMIVKEELAACTEADELAISIQKLPPDKFALVKLMLKALEESKSVS